MEQEDGKHDHENKLKQLKNLLKRNTNEAMALVVEIYSRKKQVQILNRTPSRYKAKLITLDS